MALFRGALLSLLLLVPASGWAQRPELSTVEQLQVENLRLKAQLSAALRRISELEAQQNEAALQLELDRLVEELEKRYPGFTLRDGRLEPKEEEEEEKK